MRFGGGEAGNSGSAPAGSVRVVIGAEDSKDDVVGKVAGSGSAPAGSVRVAIGAEDSKDDVVGRAAAVGSAPAGSVRVAIGAEDSKDDVVVGRAAAVGSSAHRRWGHWITTNFAADAWNALPLSLRDVPTLSQFKRGIKKALF